MSKIGIAFLIFLISFSIIIYMWFFVLTGFRAITTDCSTEQAISLKTNSSYTEVYLGGWVESGSVTITGPFRFNRERTFDLTNEEISISYIGDWYSEEFKIKIKPTKEASCFIRIIYGYKPPYKK